MLVVLAVLRAVFVLIAELGALVAFIGVAVVVMAISLVFGAIIPFMRLVHLGVDEVAKVLECGTIFAFGGIG